MTAVPPLPRASDPDGAASWQIRINVQPLSFEEVVSGFYKPLYHFALSLTGQAGDACDLTQETFYVWATKGNQLRDATKIKSWLFTTLYRQHLNSQRRQTRYLHCELASVDSELPTISPAVVRQMDAATMMQALRQIDERHRVPLTLFYLEEHSCVEIAEILNIPLGTVTTRLMRGKVLLRRLLADHASPAASNIVPLDTDPPLARRTHD